MQKFCIYGTYYTMPSISSSADANSEEPARDRYSVDRRNNRSKYDEESTDNVASLQNLTAASDDSSSCSGTFGTSFDGSETLLPDEYVKEFGHLDDLDNLSLESKHMAIDNWFDSACSCLDRPVKFYQTVCLGAETSLLRESKNSSRSMIHNNTTTSTNLKMLEAKRRNISQRDEEFSKQCETVATEEKKNEITIMRIQPREDFEFKDITEVGKNGGSSQPPNNQEFLEEDEPEMKNKLESESKDEILGNRSKEESDNSQIPEQVKTKEAHSVSTTSTKSVTEDEERDNNVGFKIDPPSDTETAADHTDLELSSFDEPSQSQSTKERKAKEIVKDPSGRGQRSQPSNMLDQLISEDASKPRTVSQTQEGGRSNDENSLSNNFEIIDVISIDDEDSWTPGSRDDDIDHLFSNIEKNSHQDASGRLTISIPLSNPTNNYERVDRPTNNGSPDADEIWIEEEAKLKKMMSSNGGRYSRPNNLAAAQSANDMWNEERMKLQATPRSNSASRDRPSNEILSMIERTEKEIDEKRKKLAQLPSRKKDLVVIRSIDEGQRIRSSKRDSSKHSSVFQNETSLHTPIDLYDFAGTSPSSGAFHEQVKQIEHKPNIDLLLQKSSSESVDPIGRKGIVNTEVASKKHSWNDERDDHESFSSTHAVGSMTSGAPLEKNWSAYDTAISATKELRKLEKKIERQLQRADLDSREDQSKEISRMEKKLSKKLRSIIKSDNQDAKTMSSRQIKRLEKQLALKLSGENENRATKLKKIKHKGVDAERGTVSSPRNLFSHKKSSQSDPNAFQSSMDYIAPHSSTSKAFAVDRPDGSRYENLKGLRARYGRRVLGRRSYSRVPEND